MAVTSMHGALSEKKCLEPVRSLRPGWGPDGGPMVTLAWDAQKVRTVRGFTHLGNWHPPHTIAIMP